MNEHMADLDKTRLNLNGDDPNRTRQAGDDPDRTRMSADPDRTRMPVGPSPRALALTATPGNAYAPASRPASTSCSTSGRAARASTAAGACPSTSRS